MDTDEPVKLIRMIESKGQTGEEYSFNSTPSLSLLDYDDDWNMYGISTGLELKVNNFSDGVATLSYSYNNNEEPSVSFDTFKSACINNKIQIVLKMNSEIVFLDDEKKIHIKNESGEIYNATNCWLDFSSIYYDKDCIIIFFESADFITSDNKYKLCQLISFSNCNIFLCANIKYAIFILKLNLHNFAIP